jgi:hypothetical protein
MDDLLQQGITAYKAGKRDEARELFIAAVKQNQDNERAWGGMYEVAKSDKERIYFLKQILRIDSNNEKARQLLNQLLPPPLTSNPSSRRKSNTELIAIISTFLCVISCAFILIISAINDGDILSILIPSNPNTPLPIPTLIALTYSAAHTQTAIVSSPAPLLSSTFVPSIENIPTATLDIYSTQTPLSVYVTNTPFVIIQPTLIVIPTTSGGGSCCKHCGSTSKPCGDTCISNSYTCHTPPGCACY